jgi:hypothetical protein
MSLIRAAVTFQGGTNLPEDRFVNTFWFNHADYVSADYAANVVAPVLDNLYMTTYAGNTIGSYLSPFVSRAAQIRFYNMADAEPRQPQVRLFTLPASIASGSGALPEECAICCTFHGDPPITPSRRGRVYIGPLSSFAFGIASTTVPTRVDANFRASAVLAFKALADANVGWVVHSPKHGTNTIVRAGYIDNAADIQRRRGPENTARTVWSAT